MPLTRQLSSLILACVLFLCAAHSACAASPTDSGMEQTAAQEQLHRDTERPLMQKLFSDSLVGTLLLGYPFTGLGTADMLVATLLLFLIMKLVLTLRSGGPKDTLEIPPPGKVSQPSATSPRPPFAPLGGNSVKQQAQDAWAYLRGTPAPPSGSVVVTDSARAPEGFDAKDFLDGARTLYARLQNSWAARNMDDIAPFVTPDMLDIIKAQAAKDPAPKSVDVLLVDASLAGVDREDSEEHARVLFNTLIRMGDAQNPSEARELWHFVRDFTTDGMWRLDAIEQVEKT